MAPDTEEGLQESGSAVRHSGTSQLPQAGPEEAAECSQCPICLGDIEDAAYVAFCLHQFCFGCIREWARSRARCPLCRQPFYLLLHSVQADDCYKEYVVSSFNLCLTTDLGRERIRSRSPLRRNRRYSSDDSLASDTDDVPSAGRRGTVGRH